MNNRYVLERLKRRKVIPSLLYDPKGSASKDYATRIGGCTWTLLANSWASWLLGDFPFCIEGTTSRGPDQHLTRSMRDAGINVPHLTWISLLLLELEDAVRLATPLVGWVGQIPLEGVRLLMTRAAFSRPLSPHLISNAKR